MSISIRFIHPHISIYCMKEGIVYNSFENFKTDEEGRLYTEIRYTKGNDTNFLDKEKTEANTNNFGFHYTPYNFDSGPEKDFYINLLNMINEKPEDIEDIYFTDIVKCAFSSNKSIKSDFCSCSKNIFREIELVNPKTIILMGTQAKNVFINLMNQNKIDMKLIKESSSAINNKQSIKFQHMKTTNQNIFFIPHFAGNLHVSNHYKKDFLIFMDQCCMYINYYLKN